MIYKSFAISFRMELGFHAANNEGAGGTNVMEPRRITVGDREYDGISGEIIRRHILEIFVRLCQEHGIPLHQRCNGLIPERCKDEVKQLMNKNNDTELSPEKNYSSLTDTILKNCALCDVGGYLVAFQDKDKIKGTIKRDSCFEVGWLITEHPAVVNYTQHSAYDPDPQKHSLFVQNMRVGIYGGVLRIDLDRIGFNDWWWLNNSSKYSIEEKERRKRIWVLLEAVRQWMLSPSFAKQAGWLQHLGGTFEGVITLSTDGPAPFCSPIKFELREGNPDQPIIRPNYEYQKVIKDLQEKLRDKLEIEIFQSPAEFNEKMDIVLQRIKSCNKG